MTELANPKWAVFEPDPHAPAVSGQYTMLPAGSHGEYLVRMRGWRWLEHQSPRATAATMIVRCPRCQETMTVDASFGHERTVHPEGRPAEPSWLQRLLRLRFVAH